MTKNQLGTPNGIVKLALKAGLDGKASINLKAKGDNVPLPVRVQLQASDGGCWQSIYSSAGLGDNSMTQFKGKAD